MKPLCVAGLIHVGIVLFCVWWAGASPFQLLIGPLKVAQLYNPTGHLDAFAIAAAMDQPRILGIFLSLGILVVTAYAVRRDGDDLSCLSTLSLASMTVGWHGGYDFAGTSDSPVLRPSGRVETCKGSVLSRCRLHDVVCR